jgi:hypothetical protein
VKRYWCARIVAVLVHQLQEHLDSFGNRQTDFFRRKQHLQTWERKADQVDACMVILN